MAANVTNFIQMQQTNIANDSYQNVLQRIGKPDNIPHIVQIPELPGAV
jgi:hypothetical protein